MHTVFMFSYDDYFSTQQKIALKFIDLEHFCDPNNDIDFGRSVFLSIIVELVNVRHERLLRIQYFIKFIEESVSDKNIATFVRLLFMMLKTGDYSEFGVSPSDFAILSKNNGGEVPLMNFVIAWKKDIDDALQK